MAIDTHTDSAPSMSSLVTGIVDDVQKLIRQELALARREVKEEWSKAKTAAVSMAAGACLLGLGVVLLSLTLVFLLDRFTAIPLWGCFAVIGGIFAAIGGGLLFAGTHKAGELSVIPPRTAETMKENAEWIQNQT